MDIPYKPELPFSPLPICILGAGGIVNDAHLPAYRMAGFPVAGIWNHGRKNLVAAINCQLRFAPFVAAARWLHAKGIWVNFAISKSA